MEMYTIPKNTYPAWGCIGMGYGAVVKPPAKMLYNIDSGINGSVHTLIYQKIFFARSIVLGAERFIPIP